MAVGVSGSVEQLDIKSEFSEIMASSWPNQVYADEFGELQTRPAKCEYLLGNKNYPVSIYREHIVDTVKNNLLTIITAKTGTGKSTHVPQFLFESGGFDRVVVTQPRIVAARELKRYVSDEIAKSLDDREHNLVGFATAPESEDSDDNAILYVTDGLQLMHEIARNGIAENQVLVLDEFHERGRNMDALLAIAVKYGIRTVVMSATLDADELSERYGQIMDRKVPIIDVPGVTYEVEEFEGGDLDSEIMKAARQGKNVLVFLPGRKEINNVMSRMRRRLPNSYTLLALHGDQTPQEQSKVFLSYPGGKIIFSTSVGQTSITIDGIDTVIDCGYERTAVLSEAGDYMLATQPASMAARDQRRGRVGRTKNGEYILAQLRGYPPLPSIQDISTYDTPAILRTRTDDLQLKLASFGHSFDDLPFYDKPSEIELNRGGERLSRLGLFKKLGKTALDGYAITPDGEKAAHLPLDVNSARMVIEARKYGSEVELQMMAATAVQQINGITMTAKGMDRWRKLSKEETSDIIAGIDYMVAAMQSDGPERYHINIVELRYKKAFRALEQLARRRNLNVYDLTSPSESQREQLLRSIIAGTDEVFTRNGRTKAGRLTYLDHDRKRRQPLASTSIKSDPDVLVGSRFNLQQVRAKKIAIHALISTASGVTPEMLIEIIPDRIKTIIEGFHIDDDGKAVTEERIIFDGYDTRKRISRIAEPGEALHKFMVEQIFTEKDIKINLPPNITKARKMINDFWRLQYRTDENLGIPESIQKILEKTIREAPYNSHSFEDIDPFIDLESVAEIVPEYIRQEISQNAPDSIIITLDDGQSINLPVEYLPDSDRACVTVLPQYYKFMPFEIAGRRVSVRVGRKSPYINLETAKYNHEQPSRSERRGVVSNTRALTNNTNSSAHQHHGLGANLSNSNPNYRDRRHIAPRY